jgi:hypothetical protein
MVLEELKCTNCDEPNYPPVNKRYVILTWCDCDPNVLKHVVVRDATFFRPMQFNDKTNGITSLLGTIKNIHGDPQTDKADPIEMWLSDEQERDVIASVQIMGTQVAELNDKIQETLANVQSLVRASPDEQLDHVIKHRDSDEPVAIVRVY